MHLGDIRLLDFLDARKGEVVGRLVTDAKKRYYAAKYDWSSAPDGLVRVRQNDRGDSVLLPASIPIDEALVAFFGLYSGDGSKGAETASGDGRVRPSISFSQHEPNLIRFATDQFRRIFPNDVAFRYTYGEDSAFFMDGEGLAELTRHYNGRLPQSLPLEKVRPTLTVSDASYLSEIRSWQREPRIDLAFYYQHKDAMEQVLCAEKQQHLLDAKIDITDRDHVKASLRKPFKKGARRYGNSSRSDETDVLGVNGIGELFLFMLHEIEASILNDTRVSPQGLICWTDVPSRIGQLIQLRDFFATNAFGKLGANRPSFVDCLPAGTHIEGRWPRGKSILVAPELRLSPLWSYASGLYFAEGTTDKNACFQALNSGRTTGFGIGFTSSEGDSIDLILRAFQELFPPQLCVETWKIKVGSQYFPELVVIGLKNAVPMLRGGPSGQGKMRSLEISLAVKDWGLSVAPALKVYSDRYSHVEPTGAGVPRIDFSASSLLCRWLFPLMIFTMFGASVADPLEFTA